ncbi:ABC transporter substrate-binding protein [Mobilicoccus caccae]|uniref:ABC transporter substrate-binding protein n=1 Tax=Mobilicoccus caccae TaxID=1859295 RepID=A0ABQ6IX58_9MICO|nr:ABC transporter substrate-binding protein [Mobilicoccus caccae]GMA41279.1 ABC transporter substrate-binding protein [Mobilicoccus caccae]
MSRESELGRRSFMRFGALALAGVAMPGLAACTAPSSDAVTSQLVHGATGGGLKDSLDPHFPVTIPDIARVRQLYESLYRFTPDYRIEPALAEEITPNADATQWTIRLRPGVTFHDGRPVTSRDVEASLARMLNPENPSPFMSDIAPIADLQSSRVLDARTYRVHLTEPYVILDRMLAGYSTGMVPADFDPENPIGTGPFSYGQFVPGQRSSFRRYADYWDVPASFDELVIANFTDDAAKVNALLAGQVQSIDNLPAYLVDAIGAQGARALVSETGGWVPFTMRVDAAPFSDVRVRQAIRLIADRQQMIDQAYSGYGRLGNDLYAPFDPDYIGNELPQRHQDIDQARALLRQAGHADLQVELVTSAGVGAGAVEAASLFAQQARRAGVSVRLNQVDSSVFYGDQYLSWVFAQDFWNTRLYLPQVAQSSLKGSPYNETHFDHPRFTELIRSAFRETDEERRRRLVQDAQRIEYEEGGFLIWAFQNQVDAYSTSLAEVQPAVEQPVSSYRFNLFRPAGTS